MMDKTVYMEDCIHLHACRRMSKIGNVKNRRCNEGCTAYDSVNDIDYVIAKWQANDILYSADSNCEWEPDHVIGGGEWFDSKSIEIPGYAKLHRSVNPVGKEVSSITMCGEKTETWWHYRENELRMLTEWIVHANKGVVGGRK